jgi:hypothetical protein
MFVMKDGQADRNPANQSVRPPLRKTPSPVTRTREEKAKLEEKLDEAIMETFPASDPISISTPDPASRPSPPTK